MKKIILSVTALVLALLMVACSSAPAVDVASSEEALNKVIDLYSEDQKFPIMGGDMANPVDSKAGKFDLTDKDSAVATLHLSEALIGKTAEAASAVHMMNANTFTAVAFKMADGVKATEYATELKDAILSTQWICGFPETLKIFTLGEEYVLYGVGAADLLEVFGAKVTEAYGDVAVTAVDQPVE